MSPGTITIKREKISPKILARVGQNVMDEIMLVYYAERSDSLAPELKETILRKVLTCGMKPSIVSQPDFERFIVALAKNIRFNLENLRIVRKTGLLPYQFKERMLEHLLLEDFDRTGMDKFDEQHLSDEDLSQYDQVLGMYGDFPDIDDPTGRSIRVQIQIIKNSQLQFVDSEKKAELLEEMLMQTDNSELQDFLVIEALARAMALESEG